MRSLLAELSLGDGPASATGRGVRYVAATLERSGGNRRERRRKPAGAAAAALALLGCALLLAACGESSSSDANEAGGVYPVKVVRAEFPPRQRLGETSLMRIGVRNAGHKTLPSLAINVSVGGKQGEDSSLPFGYRDPQPGLAQPDRPVWVLASGYPKIAGSTERGPIEPALKKTFDFGPLKPGATTEAIWKLSAVKAGRFAVLYEIGAGLSGAGKARTAGDSEAGGSFSVRIGTVPPNTEVTDSGEVVEIPSRGEKGKR